MASTGTNVVLISKDDAYDPNKTPPLVTELIEQDKIMASLIQVGTPNVAATRALYESSVHAAALRRHRLPGMGRPGEPPVDDRRHPRLQHRGRDVGRVHREQKPGAKVAQLVFNNDFGKAYQTAFEAVAEEKGFEIVETQLHEGTAADIDNEVTAILAANPDVVIGETTGAFCPKLMAGLAAGGYEGIDDHLGDVRVGGVVLQAGRSGG